MSDAYDWTQFTVHMHYYAPIEKVFQAWATAAGLESFFLSSALHASPDGSRRALDKPAVRGDRYQWTWLHGPGIEGEFLACDPGRSVAFTFGEDMRVDVELRVVEDSVEVRLHQTGCAKEDPQRAWQHLNCRSCWVYFMTNLKSVLEHGRDLRDRSHPERNDSLSIGWPSSRPSG
jgi:uncharacterized protein YndB with AHSA1/START domain